jgi:hypothetical protein
MLCVRILLNERQWMLLNDYYIRRYTVSTGIAKPGVSAGRAVSFPSTLTPINRLIRLGCAKTTRSPSLLCSEDPHESKILYRDADSRRSQRRQIRSIRLGRRTTALECALPSPRDRDPHLHHDELHRMGNYSPETPEWLKRGIGCEFGAEIALEQPTAAPRPTKTA